MKYSVPKNHSFLKAISVLTALFFVSSGTSIPVSFAGTNQLILNEDQRAVPLLTLEQANAQGAPAQDTIPSGSAIAESHPLSLPVSDEFQSKGPTDARGTIYYDPRLRACDVTKLRGNPHPYITAGSSAGTALSYAASTSQFLLKYSVPQGNDFSGFTISFDDASTSRVETQDISKLSRLVFGLQGPVPSLRFEVVDIHNVKATFTLAGISNTAERFWGIPVFLIPNTLDKTRIKAFNFIVTKSRDLFYPATGKVSIRSYGLDTSAPSQPVLTSRVPSYTNKKTLMISGTKDANTSIFINGVKVVGLDHLTTWTAKVCLPAEGENTLKIVSQNSIGLMSTPKIVTVFRDTVKPAGSLIVNGGALYTASREVNLDLSATDSGSGVDTMSFSTDNVHWTKAEAYGTSKSLTLPVGDGPKTVFVKYYDKAGNVSDVYSKSIILDTVPPVVVLDPATKHVTNVRSFTIHYTSDGVTKQKSFTDLVDGLNTLTIRETDLAGNETTVTWNVTVDVSASDFTWLYNGVGANLWSIGTNWLGGVAPGILDTAVFGIYSVSDCVIDTAITVLGMTLSSDYTGTILQQGNVSITDNFSLAGGHWVDTRPEDHSFSVGGSFAISDDGGAFNRFGDQVDDAYQIRDVYDLQAMNGFLTSNFKLTKDIDASSTIRWNSGQGFNPVGAYPGSAFSGTLEGAGHTISGLSINRPTEDYVGLFGYTAGFSLKNLGLLNVNIIGGVEVGGLVGENSGHVSPNGGSISGSYVTGSVTGQSYVGGLVGQNFFYSSIDDSYFTGSVTGSGERVGGLVGQNVWHSTLSNSYATGTVTGQSYVGGLVGVNYFYSFLSNSFAASVVTGTTKVGGLVGDQIKYLSDDNSAVFNSYFTDGAHDNGYGTYEQRGPIAFYGSSHAVYDQAGAHPWNFLNVWDSFDYAFPHLKWEHYMDPPSAWIPAPSNANYAFRVTQDAAGYRLELRYNPGGGITVLCSGTGALPDTFDVTPDGSKVIFEGNGAAYVQRIGEPWTAVTVQGDLQSIHYYGSYVMLKTDRQYPSGTVIRYSTGVTINTYNPQYLSTFYTTLITPGTGFYRNDALRLAVQVEYYPDTKQYQALVYSLYGGNDYSASIRAVDLGLETGTSGGTFTLVDAVAAPHGETVITIGLDSPTFNKTYLINQNITFDGAAIAVTYQGRYAVYTVRNNDGTVRTVRFDLETLQLVPDLPAIELVQPVITQTPSAANQWTLKWNDAMRGVRYEIQFSMDPAAGVWQTAGTFVADHYGEVFWQDPAQDRGPVVYRVVPKEITTAADLLTQINLLYFDSDFDLVESTHEYPLEAWLQRRITQPSNFGFYANLLAAIAAGELVTSVISKTEAIRRLDVMMTHLLEDQQNPNLGYKGLLPWLGYYGSDWTRMDDLYGRQVSFEDNTNLTNGLAVAYGSLLDTSLAGNTIIHAEGGLLDKIDAFLANQREGYMAMFNSANQTFARTMVIQDGRLEGTVDLFGAESSATLLFLILQYGDTFPASAYAKLNFSTRTYTMQDGSQREVVAPFSGAFQMYWPSLLMPEANDPDLRNMLETYTDVQLDFVNRNSHPGLLSASYDVGPYNLLNSQLSAFSWMGDPVNAVRGNDGSYHVTSSSNGGIGVAFADSNKFVFEGSSMQLRYSSQTPVPNARLEFKQKIDGVLQTVHVENLSLENTGGQVRTVLFELPENGVLGDLVEVVFATSDGSGPLDLTFYRIDTDRIAYNFSLGINEIAQIGVSETTPSVYNLGAAYMFRPAQVEALLQGLIVDHRNLITDHGLWEGKNMITGKLVKEQVFNNVVSFVLGMAGNGTSSMSLYLEHKGLMAELQSIWDPQTPVSLTDRIVGGNFEWDGFKATSWRLPESVRASDREIHITYQSAVTIQGAKIELKYANNNEPAYTVQFDLPATGAAAGEFILTVPASILYWYIAETVVLFPAAHGFPSASITGISLAPAAHFVPLSSKIDAAASSPASFSHSSFPRFVKGKPLNLSGSDLWSAQIRNQPKKGDGKDNETIPRPGILPPSGKIGSGQPQRFSSKTLKKSSSKEKMFLQAGAVTQKMIFDLPRRESLLLTNALSGPLAGAVFFFPWAKQTGQD